MSKFSLKEILWGATLKVNLLRVCIAGMVWSIIAYAVGMETPAGMPGLWAYTFIWPIGYFIFLPIAIVAGLLNRMGVPFAGLLTFIPSVMVMPADPIMFFIHRANKNLVPVEDYRFIEPVASIWVFERFTPESQPHMASETTASVTEDIKVETQPCRFKGRIVVNKETRVMGFEWPSKATAFIINDDWSVGTETDRQFGWIDINGEIHKGRPLGAIDPKATLSGGNTGIKVNGSFAWHKNDKFGELVFA